MENCEPKNNNLRVCVSGGHSSGDRGGIRFGRFGSLRWGDDPGHGAGSLPQCANPGRPEADDLRVCRGGLRGGRPAHQ